MTGRLLPLCVALSFLTATNLKNGTIIKEKMRFISDEQHSILTKGHIREDDLVIVVGNRGMGKTTALVQVFEGLGEDNIGMLLDNLLQPPCPENLQNELCRSS